MPMKLIDQALEARMDQIAVRSGSKKSILLERAARAVVGLAETKGEDEMQKFLNRYGGSDAKSPARRDRSGFKPAKVD